jgi:hypothetical protein
MCLSELLEPGTWSITITVELGVRLTPQSTQQRRVRFHPLRDLIGNRPDAEVVRSRLATTRNTLCR